MNRSAQLIAFVLLTSGCNLLPTGAPDGGKPDAGPAFVECRAPVAQASAFPDVATLYLSDKIGRCQDGFKQENQSTVPPLRFSWYHKDASGAFLPGSGLPYEYAAISEKPLLNGGSGIGNRETIVWLWRTGLASQGAGTVLVSDGHEAASGVETTTALSALATPKVYYLTVWAFDSKLKMAAASESRAFCLGHPGSVAVQSDEYDPACGSNLPSGLKCFAAPSAEHPDISPPARPDGGSINCP
jgi:hypothetical protein